MSPRKLQEFGELVPTPIVFQHAVDNLDRDALMLLAEIGLAMFEASAKPKSGGKSLRERMETRLDQCRSWMPPALAAHPMVAPQLAAKNNPKPVKNVAERSSMTSTLSPLWGPRPRANPTPSTLKSAP